MFYILAILGFTFVNASINLLSEKDLVFRVVGALLLIVGVGLAVWAWYIA